MERVPFRRGDRRDRLGIVLWMVGGAVCIAIAVVALGIERGAPLLFLLLVPALWIWPRMSSTRSYVLTFAGALLLAVIVVASSIGDALGSVTFWAAVACTLVVGFSIPFFVQRAIRHADSGSTGEGSVLLDETSAFLRSLFAAQEEERRRIAAELHDRIGQLLTALRYHIEHVETAWKTDVSAAEESLGAAKEILDTAFDDLHRIVANLRPQVLEDFGLVPAIHWYVRNFLEKTGLIVRVNVAPIGRLDRDLESCLFYVLQEAGANILRHAQASEVDILLQIDEDRYLQLEIADDGRGFAVEAIPVQDFAGFGLRSMMERVQSFGGTCQIDAHPGEGCRVRVVVPVAYP